MNVHRAEFRTALQRWYRFTGVKQTIGVKRELYGMKLFDLFGWKLHTHLVDLFDPDAVLTRDSSTCFDAKLEDFAAQFLGGMHFTGSVGVE